VLFDLDGTLIDSIAAVNRAWAAWSRKVGLDPALVLPRIHGRRFLDSVRDLAPHLDAEAEDAWLQEFEAENTEAVALLPGARALLSAVQGFPWGIVTSGTSNVALARMAAADLPVPDVCVFGEDVERGKPDPGPFRLGCERMKLLPGQVLAFEDTLPGVQSALAAGCWCVWRGGESHRNRRVLCIRGYQEIALLAQNDHVVLSRVV
jgi:sugar-phosphatase